MTGDRRQGCDAGGKGRLGNGEVYSLAKSVLDSHHSVWTTQRSFWKIKCCIGPCVFVKRRMEGVLKGFVPTKVLPTATSVELERSPEVQARINNCCGEGFLFSFYGADGFAAVAES